MWIGTSLGKCVKDILEGVVKEDDVMFIVANTMCYDLAVLLEIVEEYHHGANGRAYNTSAYAIEDVKALTQRLYEAGKIHQPRLYNTRYSNSHKLKETWHEVVPTLSTHNESVVEAYSQYRVLAILAE